MTSWPGGGDTDPYEEDDMNGGFIARPLPHCPHYNFRDGTYCHLPEGHEGERDHDMVPVEDNNG